VNPTRAPFTREAWIVLLITGVAAFLTPFMVSAITVALPDLAHRLGLGAAWLSWIPGAYLIATTVLLLPAGRFADQVGRKRVYLAGMALYTLASTLCALAPDRWFLLVGRILQGVGAALLFATSLAILVSSIPPSRRGEVLGINVAATYAGLTAGPFIGGLLTSTWGWRGVFWFNVPLGIVLIWLTARFLPADRSSAGRLDPPSILLYTLSLLGISIGLFRLPHWESIVLLLPGGALLHRFWRRNRTVPNPLIDLIPFRLQPGLKFANLATLIHYSATYAVAFLMSLYLHHLHRLSPTAIGTILVTQPLMMALFSPLTGRLSDRQNPRVIATLGMAMTTLGLLAFSFLTAATPRSWIIAVLLWQGLGYALFSSPNTLSVMSAAGPAASGFASSFLATMRIAGQMVSMGISAVVFARMIGPRAIASHPQLLLAAVRLCFAICTALGVLGVAASLAGRIHARSGAAGD